VAVTPGGDLVVAEQLNSAIRVVDADVGTASPPVAAVAGCAEIGTASFGNASATVRWTAPSTDRGSAITEYLVRAVDSAAAQVGALRPADATATGLVVSGLTNESSYRSRSRRPTPSARARLGAVHGRHSGNGAGCAGDRNRRLGHRRRNHHRDRQLEPSNQHRRIGNHRVPGPRTAHVDNRHRAGDHDLGNPAGLGPAADHDAADR
jgi:hypothetical protein